MLNTIPLFDSHLHIIDPNYPLIVNQGFSPEAYTSRDYLQRLADYQLVGGVVVSGSFQGFDQSYLLAALDELGDKFIGVTQLPEQIDDEQILLLNGRGVRGVRFNLHRGGKDQLKYLNRMAHRLYELAGWHVELYVNAADLGELMTQLVSLPAVSIDHLGLSVKGQTNLIKLVEQGVRVKATGFGRVDFSVVSALKQIYSANPNAVMFGTDLPSTRAPRPYDDKDFITVIEALGETAARQVFANNALVFYRVTD